MNALAARGTPTAKELRAALERVARSACTSVLIEAERGTPAAAVVETLHRLSARGAHPLVELRRPEELEFALARAGRGTLALGDLALLDAALQERLVLRLAQRRVDGPALDCRLVALLRASADELAASGRVRDDLLHRLNGASLRLPPLRERRAEIPALVRALDADVSADAIAALGAHDWPGNDRELELVLERARLVAGEGTLEPGHLALATRSEPDRDRGRNDSLPLGDRSWRAVEEALIRRVLDEEGGNKSRAAAVLGLHRATLHQKIREHRIAPGTVGD